MSRRTRNKKSSSNLRLPVSPRKPGGSQATPHSNAGSLLGYSVVLAAATFLVYLPITHHPFIHYDDEVYIYQNPFIQSGLNPSTIKWGFTSFYAANWHPLTWILHALNVQLFGLDPGGHHFISLLLHVANAILLFLVLNFALRAPVRSFFAAAFFALHPMNVESVAWAAELKNLLCTFFFLTTVAAYFWYAHRPVLSRYAPVLFAFSLGLAAKPMVITLPFVLLLLDYWPLSRIETLTEASASNPVPQWSALHLALEKLPLIALSAASSWITLRAQRAGHATTMIHPSLCLRLANAVVSYATYVLRMFVPTGLAPFYPFPTQGIPRWQIFFSVLLLLAVSAAVLVYGRRHRYLIAGWLWFLGALVPVIGLLQVGGQSRADRYLYIPMIGLLLMVVWGFAELAEQGKWGASLRLAPAVLAVIALFALTSHQIAYWKSPYSLWPHTIAVTGDNAIAERNLRDELLRAGRDAEAFPHAVRAVALDPSDWSSHYDLGSYYLFQGKRQEAVGEFKTVIDNSEDPGLVFAAAINIGSAYTSLGNFGDAEAAYRRALALTPNDPTALAGLNRLARARALSSPASSH